ncbi:MAG: S8 family serine peptidase [Bacteroidota bacterium]
MSKLQIKTAKGALTLKKSKALVGLKAKNLAKAQAVDREIFPHLGGFTVVTLDKQGKSVDTRLDEVRQDEQVEVGTHVYYANGSQRPLVPTGEIYIIYEAGVSEEEQLLVLDEFNLKMVERRDPTMIIAAVTAHSPNPLKVAQAIQQTSLVKIAEPDLDTIVDAYPFVAPTDHLVDHQWHLKNEGTVIDANWRLKKGADAKVVDAWQRLGGFGSQQVVVAVIDNGFDISHPDLKNKIHKPYDLWNQSSRLVSGDPRFTHGTPCASIAIAASNNSGIVGAAPNAKFMPISGTSFSLRATEQMFDYCIKNGADVISCSWGTTDPAFRLSPMKEAVLTKAATKGRNGRGCIILYAAGNDDLEYVNYYGTHPDVITVAACTSKDQHAAYSNRGREVFICAPSNGDWPITAARAWWDEGVSWESGAYRYWRDGKSRGDGYKHFGGTSASTPLVAGICALILSANPELTAKQVKNILRKTADKIGSPNEYNSDGHSNKFGYGRVNAGKAVAEALRLKDSKGNADAGPGTVVEVEDKVASGRGLFRFSVTRQESKGWGVQIGAFAEYGNVLIQAEKLESLLGEPVIVNINELNGKTVYKIVVGAFANINDARKLKKRMTENGVNGFLRNLKDMK